jgi:hypothetical protein
VDKIMTLEAYDPDRLDALSLRLLDACSRVRALALLARSEGLERIDLHDRKALEWLENLEEWLHRSEGELRAAAHRNRGQRLARQAQSAPPGKRESAKKR